MIRSLDWTEGGKSAEAERCWYMCHNRFTRYTYRDADAPSGYRTLVTISFVQGIHLFGNMSIALASLLRPRTLDTSLDYWLLDVNL